VLVLLKAEQFFVAAFLVVLDNFKKLLPNVGLDAEFHVQAKSGVHQNRSAS
jgi:hypothetical protein